MRITYNRLLNEIFPALDSIDIEVKDKLSYALSKNIPKVNTITQAYNDSLSDTNIEYCETDEKGIILQDEKGGFRFSKEGLKKRNAAIKELQLKEIEVDFFKCAESKRIEELPLPIQFTLNGILFDIDLE